MGSKRDGEMTIPIVLAAFSRTFLAIVFLSAFFGKLKNFFSFAESVDEMLQLSNRRWSRAIACIVIALEASVFVFLLLGGAFEKIGAVLALAMFAVFTLLLSKIVFGRRIVRCHCFGATADVVTWLDLVRNLILISFVTMLLSTPSAGFFPTGISMAQWMALIALSITLFIYISNLSSLSILFRSFSQGAE